MNGRDLARFVDKPIWFEFRVFGGFKAQVLPPMQILPESGEDSIAPLTAQCEQIDSSIVQLRCEKKNGGANGKRDARKKAIVRKLREELSESRLRKYPRKWCRPSGSISMTLKRYCWWACRLQDGTCDVP